MISTSSPFAPIERQDLPNLAVRQLRKLIVGGRLAPGTPLVEREVSAQLGVSRTPLREALAELSREGLVTARGGRGLQVAPLDPDEVRQIYPVIAALERCALAAASPFTPGQLDELHRTNDLFWESEQDPVARVELNDRWHHLLIATSENRVAADLLAPLKRRAHRYELSYLADSKLVQRSAREHAGIHAALARGDNEAAAKKLDAHWRVGVELMLAAIAARNELSPNLN